MSRLFCFGLGYCAQALAETLAERGWTIAGTTRDPRKRAALEERGWRVFLFDREHPLPPDALEGATHLLSSIAPDIDGDPVLDLCKLDPNAAWIGYLSSTGVYGDHDGAWVDEASPLHPPTSERAARRVAAEARWRERGDAHVFRLAGIYGPGRNALARARAGRARRIDKPGLCFSRIHQTDIVAVLLASIARPRPGAIYNVADEQPAPAHEVTAYACALLGLTPPPLEPFDPEQLSAGLAAFYRDDKKVRADRIRTELGVTLRYPTYAEGLRALAQL